MRPYIEESKTVSTNLEDGTMVINLEQYKNYDLQFIKSNANTTIELGKYIVIKAE